MHTCRCLCVRDVLWRARGRHCVCRFWDDWMRHPDQRHDRSCIRPEISRTNTFGKIGVSKYVQFCRCVELMPNSVHMMSQSTYMYMYLMLSLVHWEIRMCIDYNVNGCCYVLEHFLNISEDSSSRSISSLLYSMRNMCLLPKRTFPTY